MVLLDVRLYGRKIDIIARYFVRHEFVGFDKRFVNSGDALAAEQEFEKRVQQSGKIPHILLPIMGQRPFSL